MGSSQSRGRRGQNPGASETLDAPLMKGYQFPKERKSRRGMVDYGKKALRQASRPVFPGQETAAEERRKQQASELYDYCIIFDRPKDTGVGGAEEDSEESSAVERARRRLKEDVADDEEDLEAGEEQDDEDAGAARISWKEVSVMWFQTIPGEEEAKNKGVNWLKRVWMERFRTTEPQNGDRIPVVALQGLVREHVVDVLRRKAGLQLKIVKSGSGRQLYCLIRAPSVLLERKADAINYRLRFKREIDPGTAFWRTPYHAPDGRIEYVEIEEEKRLLDKASANETLEELYGAEKIGPNDMEVFSEAYEPTPRHWSRRVHALERIADKVPCTNRYPAYSDFSTQPHLRHLYEEYPSALRGQTLFLPKDRLYLTKRIIDEYFDFGVLTEQGVVKNATALHDAAFGEVVTREWFLDRWVFFWRAKAHEAGAPHVSHPSIDDAMECPCPLYMRLWAQPLMDVRSYFGEKIAFYFAWVGFYGYALVTPTFVGLACSLYDGITSTADESRGLKPDMLVFAICVVAWSASYKEAWDVESKWCAIKWGTTNFTEEEFDRPQFVGDSSEPLRVSPITYQMETYFPESKRSARKLTSFVAIFFVVTLVVALNLIVFALGYLAETSGYTLIASSVPVFVLALLIPVASERYAELAAYLNDVENYRTETNYENNLILKKFLFELPNSFGALAITAFVKGTLFVCTSGTNNCVMDLQILLLMIFATRFFFAITSAFSNEIGRCCGFGTPASSSSSSSDTTPTKKQQHVANPIVGALFGKNRGPAGADNDDDDDENIGDYRGPRVFDDDDQDEVDLERETEDAVFSEIEAPRFEAELALEPYEGTFDDYAEIVLQMGLVTMFSIGFYATPFLAALEILLQIRVDAYKLCALTQRPDATLAEDVGSWGSLMDVMGWIAVFTNAGIIVWTTTAFVTSTFLERLFVFFILQHGLAVVKLATHFLLDGAAPEDLETTVKRNKVVEDRHKGGADTDDEYLDDLDDDDDDDGFFGDDPADAKKADSKKKQKTDAKARKKGNVDRDALQASNVGAKDAELDEATKRNLDWLRHKLRDCGTDIKIARQQYREACRTEDFRSDLGVSYSRKQPDLALGMITLLILEAENVGTKHAPIDPKSCRVVVHVRDSTRPQDRKYSGSVGPGPQVSRPAKRAALHAQADQAEKRKATYGARLAFNQSFTLAPIKSAKAELFLEIVDASKQQRRAHAALPLSDLTDQQQHPLTLVLLRATPPRADDEAAVLYVKARFQYSRIAPLKQRIYTLLDEQRRIERDIMYLQLGKQPENPWNFPELPDSAARGLPEEEDDDGLPRED